MNCNLATPSFGYSRTGVWWAAAVLLIFPSILAAQSFETQTDPKEVTLGNTFEVAFLLKGAQGERFKAPGFSDFKIIAGPSEMPGVTIINGRPTPHQTWTYELEPRRTGTFTIGAASVTADGKTLTTKPVPFKVKPNITPPGATDDIFIVGELDRTNAYLGQQVTWRLKLYNQVTAEKPDVIGWPNFHGFYHKEKKRFDPRVQTQTIRGKKYNVRTLHEMAFFPNETGEVTIGSAKVRVGIEQPGAVGIWNSLKFVVLETLPVILNVKNFPAPLPDSFSGGVGRYDWALQTDRDSLSTDDALTLTLSIRGNGDSKRFAVPKLVLPAGLEGFEPKIIEEEEYENGEELVHSKVLEYVILPKEPGEYTLTPSLVFFDPDSNRFHTLTADSLPVIRVAAGKNYRPGQPGSDTLLLPPPAVSPGFDVWEKISGWLQSPFVWGVSVFFVLAFGIFRLLKKSKKPVAATAAVTSNRRAGKTARERFASAARFLNGGDPRAFYDELFKTLQDYLATKLNLTPAQMTQETVRKMLTERNTPAGTIQNLLVVWQTCEQALFAGQTQAAQMDSTWRTAESVVQDLEKTYQR